MAVSWTDPATGSPKRGLSWDEFVDHAATRLGARPDLLRVRGDSLQILEYLRIKEHGLGGLINWLMLQMRAPDAALQASPIHAALSRLDRCSVFYTTNYDDYLERGLTVHGRAAKTVALEDHMGSTAGPCEVVKFHGDFAWPGDMVVSESDYLKRLSFSSPMDWRLRADLLGRAVVFLGYSFRDSNVVYLFHLVDNLFKELPRSAAGRRAYILVPDPSDFERTLYRQRNMEVIPITQQTLADDTAAFLVDLRS